MTQAVLLVLAIMVVAMVLLVLVARMEATSTGPRLGSGHPLRSLLRRVSRLRR